MPTTNLSIVEFYGNFTVVEIHFDKSVEYEEMVRITKRRQKC